MTPPTLARTGALIGALLAAPIALPAAAGPLRKLPQAAARGQADALVDALAHPKAYARELAARQLARLPRDAAAEEALLACVGRRDERGFVRAACAFTLSRWKVKDADGPIAAALPEVDAESRYWMAEALHHLDTRAARAAVAGLQADPDLYISASAREWSR
jgi:hypothetical protein